MWPFGDYFDEPEPPKKPAATNVVAFPHMRPVEPPHEQGESASFVPCNFASVDEVLWKVRADIRRGLMDPSAVLVVTYDKSREKVVWYQFGREDDEVDAVIHDWFEDFIR